MGTVWATVKRSTAPSVQIVRMQEALLIPSNGMCREGFAPVLNGAADGLCRERYAQVLNGAADGLCREKYAQVLNGTADGLCRENMHRC
jgi:hypothetical protein